MVLHQYCNVLLAEWTKVDRRGLTQQCRARFDVAVPCALTVSTRGEYQCPRGPQGGHKMCQQPQRRLLCVVHVVENQ